MTRVNPLVTCMATVVLVVGNVGSADENGGNKVENASYQSSSFVNGEIHVNAYGATEGEPLTSGHQDFKPSWSKTGDMLAFFRRLKNDPDVSKWKTAINSSR